MAHGDGGPRNGSSAAGLRWRVGIITLASLAMMIMLAAGTTLWDRDEPRFARAAVEMLRSGNYLLPTFNGELRPDKPPLIYWLMTVGLRVFGYGEIAVRIFSSLGVAAAGVLTFLIGRRMFDARVGLWAMAMLLTTILTVYIGAAAMADGVLLALITLAIYAFVEMLYDGVRWWRMAILAGTLGLAQLTKGPAGLAIPLLTIICAAWWARGTRPMPGRFWWGLTAAVIVSVAIFAAWGVPANAQSGGRLLEQGLGRHVIKRMVSPMDGHGGRGLAGYLIALPAYFPLLTAGFFPWTLILPGALVALSRRRIGTPESRAVLWGWIIPTFALMSLVATKLPHYILPIYPGLALACAATLETWRRQAGWDACDLRGAALQRPEVDWLRAGAWFFGPIGAGIAAGLCAWPWLARRDGAWPAAVVGAAIGALTVWIVRQHLKHRFSRSSQVMLGAVPAFVVLALALALPSIEAELKISPALAAAVHAQPAGTPVSMTGYREPSLVFYLDQPIGSPVGIIDGSSDAIAEWSRERGPAMLIVKSDQLEAAERSQGPLGLAVLASRSTLNYSARGTRVNVMVVARHRAAASAETARRSQARSDGE